MRRLATPLVALLVMVWHAPAAGGDTIMTPDGGRLDAVDERGVLVGPCPLRHTDVRVHVAGPFARTEVRQQYHNPYDRPIEAVYTFPLSHEGAVDRMVMSSGDRVIVGEVQERREARRRYEAARDQGYLAGLLEQERPDVFTQSIANVQPGAQVEIEISYVELIEPVDGRFELVFPMVVAPRYIPGSRGAATGSPGLLPAGLEPRHGLVLAAPGDVTITGTGDVDAVIGLTPAALHRLLLGAVPIAAPDEAWFVGGPPVLRHRFEVEMAGGARERGTLHAGGTGQLAGRWFFADPSRRGGGTGFAADTTRVPDASRITPMPVRPSRRAGHDVAVTVTIDSGGPGIVGLESEGHEIVTASAERRDDGTPRRIRVELMDQAEIPNRDFVLSWRQTDEAIQESVLTHSGPHGRFVSLVLAPPARVADERAVARELVFVLDSSGSMSGFPIEKAKAIMAAAIDTMRPGDTFNVITFNNTASALWPRSRPGTAEHRGAARAYVESRQGGGGTEMVEGVRLALAPAAAGDEDERPLRVVLFLSDGEIGNDTEVIETVRELAGASRLFTVGIGSSPNRSLLDAMAGAGRGTCDFVSLEGDADAAVTRFVSRVRTPVLTDLEIDVEGDLAGVIWSPPLEELPDLFDRRPIVVHGRIDEGGRQRTAGGRLVVRGRTGAGRYERALDLDLSAPRPEHQVIATMWARERVRRLSREGDPAPIIALGKRFGIMTAHTSFVAVEKSRVTVGDRPMLVTVPVEMPMGQSWAGTFGWARDARELLGAWDGDAEARRAALDAAAARRMQRAASTGDPMIIHLEHADAATVARGLNELLSEAGSNIAMDRSGRSAREGGEMRFPWMSGGARRASTRGGGAAESTGNFNVSERAKLEQVRRPLLGDIPVVGDSFTNNTGGLVQGFEGRPPAQRARLEVVAVDHDSLALIAPPRYAEKLEELVRMLDQPADAPGAAAPPTDIRAVLYRHLSATADDPERHTRLRVISMLLAGADDEVRPLVETLLAVTLIRHGALRDGSAIAAELASRHEDLAPMRELTRILADAVQDDATRAARLERLDGDLRQTIRDLSAARVAEARLARVLDERLRDAHQGAEPILVSVLLEDGGPDAAAALSRAGFQVTAKARSHPHWVGTIAPERLEELAMVEIVRRIEPAG